MIEMFSEFKELKNEKDRAISFWKIIISLRSNCVFYKAKHIESFLMEKIFVISRQKTYLKIILASRIYPMPPMKEMFSEELEIYTAKN